jgi:hypothetical protein
MTQKNFQYTDEIDFSFTPDSSPENGNYIPHHYRVQVKATFVSGSVDTCVGIGVHLQADAGRQEFDVCADGSWYFYEEPLNSATETEGDSGTLPTVKSSYLIAVDVTDTAQTLIVDNKTVTTESDVTYSSTDEIALVLSGYQIPLVPIKALFSDFRYTPYNS